MLTLNVFKKCIIIDKTLTTNFYTILRNKAKKRYQQNNSKLVIKAINVLVLPLFSVFLNWKKNGLTFENNRGNSNWNI